MTVEPAPDVVCADRDTAEAEASRRNRDQPDAQTEWIYLRDAEHRWVARRVERHPDLAGSEGERSSRWWWVGALIDAAATAWGGF